MALGMNIGELCNRTVVITCPEATVREAAQLMRRHHVGDLVVVEPQADGSNEPVGIVTDRDLVIEAMATGADQDALPVSSVMTAELVTSRAEDDPADVLARMRSFGVRRMPIVDSAGALVGIMTYDDFIDWLAEELRELVGVARVEERREQERLP